jgi:uncharacterized damage-inducible protein DinB
MAGAPVAVPTDEVSVFREHYQRFRGVTLQTLKLVPAEKLEYRPHQRARTLGQQLMHIAEVEHFYITGLLDGVWEFDPPDPYITLESLEFRLAMERERTLERLYEVDRIKLAQVVDVPNIPVQWPVRSWLWYIVEHEIHHRSQVAHALRLLEIRPSFWGYVFPHGFRPDELV